jgi:hypothetical protein
MMGRMMNWRKAVRHCHLAKMPLKAQLKAQLKMPLMLGLMRERAARHHIA